MFPAQENMKPAVIDSRMGEMMKMHGDALRMLVALEKIRIGDTGGVSLEDLNRIRKTSKRLYDHAISFFTHESSGRGLLADMAHAYACFSYLPNGVICFGVHLQSTPVAVDWEDLWLLWMAFNADFAAGVLGDERIVAALKNPELMNVPISLEK